MVKILLRPIISFLQDFSGEANFIISFVFLMYHFFEVTLAFWNVVA